MFNENEILFYEKILKCEDMQEMILRLMVNTFSENSRYILRNHYRRQEDFIKRREDHSNERPSKVINENEILF